jgi:metacaspase-1
MPLDTANSLKWPQLPDGLLAMTSGRALCIGIDSSESSEALAEADARALADVARQQGFELTTLLLGAAATRANVRTQIHTAAHACRPGDLFMVTFSGHGGERGIWMLADASLQDSEMREALGLFRPDVRVLVISDACNGGVPIEAPDSQRSAIVAPVLVLAACGRDQLADGPGMPAHFTTALLRTLHGAQTYRTLYERIAAGMPEHQQPGLFWVGTRDPQFEAQRPFTI